MESYGNEYDDDDKFLYHGLLSARRLLDVGKYEEAAVVMATVGEAYVEIQSEI